MPLRVLRFSQTQVSDLSPLRGMKLGMLFCHQAKVTDLSVLKGMPLQTLVCDFKLERDAEILRSMKTLVNINNKPVEQFWKEVEVMQPGKEP
jgi:hypothetical protein